MKQTRNQLLTRKQAAAQLNMEVYAFDNLRTEGRIIPVVRLGRSRPEYWERDVLALKQQLRPQPVARTV